MPLVVPATLEPATSYVPPRERRRQMAGLAEVLAELREIANPLGDDVPRAKRPPITFTCIVCGVRFEGRYKTACYCGGACRIAHWRAEQ